MNLPDPSALPLRTALVVFSLAAAVVWMAGARLTRATEHVSTKTGLGQAFLGLVLLGFATSLPEIATTVVAASGGNAQLAVSNLLGGVAAQVALLALADAAWRRGALTASALPATVVLQGVLLVGMLALAVASMAVGDISLGRIGALSLLLMAAYFSSVWILKRSNAREAWRSGDVEDEAGEEPSEEEPPGWPRLSIVLAASGLAILVAGAVLARSAEAISDHTGLGSSFVGVVFLALATSMPEISTTLTAARLGLATMAISNIFGTNLLEVGLLFVADLAYAPGPLLDEGGRFAIVAATLGIVLTCIYLVGFLERRNRTFLGLGLDSCAVVLTYLAGVALLYSLR